MGDGWWQASDGKWYPPEQHPDVTASGSTAAPEPPADPPATEAAPTEAPPTDAPPAEPPATSTGGSGAGGSGGGKRILVAVVVVIALVAAGFVAFTVLDDDEASASTVTLESLGEAGEAPYTEPVAPPPSASLADFADGGTPEGAQLASVDTDEDSGYRMADGGVPGVFGGTLDESACDAGQLAEFLQGEPDKAAAWASVLEIDPADVGDYVDRLTPVNLTADTRVLNHGYVDGEPAPRQSVLQRGTAVLVDSRGVPRVNCYSGNPLREPEVVADESYAGDAWDTFSEGEVLVVRQAARDLDEFELLDYQTGERFRRPAGAVSPRELDDTATREIGDGDEIRTGTTIEGEITEARPEARYTVDIPDGAVITLSVANERESRRALHLEMGASGSRLDSFRVSPGADEERTYVLDHASGDSFDLVFTEGPAAFTFEVDVEVQDDGGSGGDAGDDPSTAVEVDAGNEVVGLLGSGDSVDLYTLGLEPGTELRLTASNERGSDRPYLLQLDTEGSLLFSERIAPGRDVDLSILLGSDDDGILDISVREGPADYTFTIELVPQRDGGEEGDAGEDLASARELTDVSAIVGTVGDRDETDVFVFEAAGPTMQVKATNADDSNRAYRLQILGADGGHRASFRVAPGATQTETFETEPGTRHQLIVNEGRATYTVGIAPAGG